MYSWGGVGQKFPNDEENFRIFHGIRSHEGICYPENEDAIYKQKYTYFTQRHITEACSAVGSFYWGLGRPEEILRFRFSEMPFPGLWGSFERILMVMIRKRSFSMIIVTLL
jgi:hypothetical protein